jgi:hypothetical protein
MGAIKPKGLNRIARIGYGHLCMREENLSISVIRSCKSMDNVDSGIQGLNPIEPGCRPITFYKITWQTYISVTSRAKDVTWNNCF